MKLQISAIIATLVMATAVLFLNLGDILSAPPNYLNYQGRIKQGGKAITGDRFFEFKITNSDGTEVYWTSGSTKVWVSGGLFRYVLGPLDNVNFKDIEPYLEIKVGETSPTTLMLPREKIVSSLYSIFSASSSYSYQTLNATFLSNRPYDAFVSTRAENQTIAGVKIFTSTTIFQGAVRMENVPIGGDYPLQITTGGLVYRGSSSVKYKTDICHIDEVKRVLKLNPVKFKWKKSGREDVGLIAEDVDRILKELVIYDEYNNPDGVKYDRLSLYLLEILKIHQNEIDMLNSKILEFSER